VGCAVASGIAETEWGKKVSLLFYAENSQLGGTSGPKMEAAKKVGISTVAAVGN
jgi:hypothetical protein